MQIWSVLVEIWYSSASFNLATIQSCNNATSILQQGTFNLATTHNKDNAGGWGWGRWGVVAAGPSAQGHALALRALRAPGPSGGVWGAEPPSCRGCPGVQGGDDPSAQGPRAPLALGPRGPKGWQTLKALRALGPRGSLALGPPGNGNCSSFRLKLS